MNKYLKTAAIKFECFESTSIINRSIFIDIDNDNNIKNNDNNNNSNLFIYFLFLSIHSVLESNNTLQVSDDVNDGSTTDGSISILGDHDINQGRFDSDDLSTHTPTPQPLQMWMRCTPIDIKKSSDQSRLYKTICRKRSREQNRFQPQPSEVVELSSQSPDLVDEIFGCLEGLNNFLSNIYMLQVILLFLTASSVACLAIIYSRYSAGKLEIKDLEQKLYSAKMDKFQIEGNLARCEYLYEMEIDRTTNSEFKLATDNGDKIMPAVHSQTNCQTNDLNGECVIQPTRLSDSYAKQEADIKLQTVWTGEGDDLLASKKPYKSKDNFLPDCNDESSLFSEYNREYCETQKKQTHDHKDHQKVYATHYSYKAIDDRECNPNKIDFSLGIEHAKNILRETKCDDDGTMKYLQKAYENYQTKLKDDEIKPHKEFHKKKINKTNGKWEKTQKFNNSIIKVDKYDGHSPEERIDRHDQRKDRRDKKHQKEKESDKENKRKVDRKDGKKYQPEKEKEKETNKRNNKNDRKRDMVKVYDHQHND